MANKQRNDPINKKFYAPLRMLDAIGDWVFYFSVAISLAVVFTLRSKYPEWYDREQMMFVVSVIMGFVIALTSRLYLTPRAIDARRMEFLSKGYDVPLSHEKTQDYYNNYEPPGTRRIAAQALENAFFSKSIALKMIVLERIKVLAAIVIFILLVREPDLGLASIAAVTIFGEQIIIKYVRLELFRVRSENTYNRLFELFTDNPVEKIFQTKAIDNFCYYETGKAIAGVYLSDKIFKKLNEDLSEEWQRIKMTLNIQ